MLTAIRWFANNSVAANLLMIMLLVGGGLSLVITNQEEFPMFEIPVVRVGVPYLGAAPVEVEKSVCIRIEEAIEGSREPPMTMARTSLHCQDLMSTHSHRP